MYDFERAKLLIDIISRGDHGPSQRKIASAAADELKAMVAAEESETGEASKGYLEQQIEDGKKKSTEQVRKI